MSFPASRPNRRVTPTVPRGLVTASEWAWRTLVIAAFVIGGWYLMKTFSGVAIPLAVAMLLTALLTPIREQFERWRLKPVLATVAAMLLTVVVMAAVFTAIGAQVVREWPQLFDQAGQAVTDLLAWLAAGPLHIEAAQLQEYYAQFTTWLNESRAEIAAALASAGVGVGHFLAGLAIALIATFFFLSGGKGIWLAGLRLVPEHYRVQTDRAAGRGWVSLVAYMRAQVLVAFVDALGMLIGALILGIPMAWALFAFTFITAFVPVVGAVLSGTIAVLLALVSGGPVTAVIMLGITVLVVQTEGHFLQPILLGRAVSLHPLAVLIGLAVGATLAGIVGALLVIPTLAFAVAFIRGLDPERFPEVQTNRH